MRVGSIVSPCYTQGKPGQYDLGHKEPGYIHLFLIHDIVWETIIHGNSPFLNMSQRTVIVIGGGIIGASCAYFLSKNGLAVTLLEKRHFGSGASGCSAAMLECQTHAYRGDPFLSLAKMSLDLFPTLAKELDALSCVNFEYERCGILNLAMNEADVQFFKSCVESQRKLGLQAEWLDPSALEIEFPQINPEYLGGAFYREDGQVNGEMFLDALLDGARQKGVQLFENTGPVRIDRTPEGVKAVTTDRVYEADMYVVAAGAWSGEVLGSLFSPKITPVRGQLVFYSTPPMYLKAPLFTRNHGYVVPKRSGYSLVGTTVENVGYDESTTKEAMEELTRKGEFLVPKLSRCTKRGISCGLRPQSADDLPLIGPLPHQKNVFVAAGHFRNGMLLAPITGKIIADMVMGTDPGMDMAPFSPGRFHKN